MEHPQTEATVETNEARDQEPAQASAEQMVSITSLDQMASLITFWHQKQVATLHHIAQVPEGVDMQIGEGEMIKLEGDLMKAFKAGLGIALDYLGTLPFNVTVDPVPPAEANEQPAEPAAV